MKWQHQVNIKTYLIDTLRDIWGSNYHGEIADLCNQLEKSRSTEDYMKLVYFIMDSCPSVKTGIERYAHKHRLIKIFDRQLDDLLDGKVTQITFKLGDYP